MSQGTPPVLSEKERELLTKLRAYMASSGKESVTLEELSSATGMSYSTVASIAMLLRDKGLVALYEKPVEVLELTERGLDALRNGLPEEPLISALSSHGGSMSLDEARRLLGNSLNLALKVSIREGYVRVENNRVLLVDEHAAERVTRLRQALEAASRGVRPSDDVLKTLRERGLVKVSQKYTFSAALGTAASIVISSPTSAPTPLAPSELTAPAPISRLTHELLASGRWKEYQLAPYNVTAEPPRLLPARKHPLVDFIEELKDIMVSMGFEEVEGPLIELELFNFDALFQPQDHPAREMQDTLWPDLPPADLSPYSELVKRVRDNHERGWGYRWDERVASRYILRSQTTAVSIRTLLRSRRPPVRAFTVDKVFRADAIDATHLSDFHQLDGIIGYPGLTFRDLLGVLREFSRRLGLEVVFKPAYFPFTEPSVEGYTKINGKMVEVFGAGLFRPEVLSIVGVDFPVGAWGMGVERLALAKLGLNDVRLLYSPDVEFLRSLKAEV